MIELESVTDLWGEGYWYVGTPYTNYHLGHETAHHYAKRIDAALESHGVRAFVPVAIGHEIGKRTGLVPTDYEFWDEFCAPLIRKARGLLIVRFAGWDTSRGISLERSHFVGVGKPVLVCDPEMLLDYRIERAPPAQSQNIRWSKTLAPRGDGQGIQNGRNSRNAALRPCGGPEAI